MNIVKGDRVELVSMGEDPDPIAPGTQGTVTFVNGVRGRDARGGQGYQQIAVDWDNGRSLMAVCPPDRLRRIHPPEVRK